MNPLFLHATVAALALFAFGPAVRADLGSTAASASVRGGAGLGKARVPAPTWLGVSIGEAPIEISARLPIEPGTGIVVDQVIAGSPAAIAGLQRGDLLARLNEQTLVTTKQLQTLVMRRKAGEQVELTYFRRGEKRKVIVVLLPKERM